MGSRCMKPLGERGLRGSGSCDLQLSLGDYTMLALLLF